MRCKKSSNSSNYYSIQSPNFRNMSEYHGRFAPSPTGKLHFGSLVAAMASYADARFHQGRWSIRIDDIDLPRVIPGSEQAILNKLENLGFKWDGEVIHQSSRNLHYQSALELLEQKKVVFACGCSRKEVQSLSHNGIYPGTCRSGLKNGKAARLKRFNTQGKIVSFSDLIQGRQRVELETTSGDFIVHRADGIFAYHLATVVDDYLAGITHVVRGVDLLSSTPNQILLQQCLDYPTPVYAHIPLIVDQKQQKLGKQTRAEEVAHQLSTLLQAAELLGQKVDKKILSTSPSEFWQELIKNWRISNIPPVFSMIKTE